MDSGSTLTYLPNNLYLKVLITTGNVIGWDFEEVPDPQFGLCYQVNSKQDILRFQPFTFHFALDNQWKVEPQNLFLQVDGTKHCLSMATPPNVDFGIFGSHMQIDKYVQYDLGRKLLSFAPANCKEI
ncbi:hypothetical protein AMTR_s00057p00163870 [Amborella trichopoda]|uniref:Peptidase A1 domain-containing protein n=1 Tax=Amborella trichopoda TaxID=13333 RepID=U5D924_AMBTC|nr:hypothetical protein AMTR_s00057p00163870 [Amborella trichopoda]